MASNSSEDTIYPMTNKWWNSLSEAQKKCPFRRADRLHALKVEGAWNSEIQKSKDRILELYGAPYLAWKEVQDRPSPSGRSASVSNMYLFYDACLGLQTAFKELFVSACHHDFYSPEKFKEIVEWAEKACPELIWGAPRANPLLHHHTPLPPRERAIVKEFFDKRA